MSLIEVLTVNLGAAIAKAAAKIWLKESPIIGEVANSFVDLFKKRIENFETRRSTEHLFSDLQDDVAKRLERLIDAEFSMLQPNDREAAALAVSEMINDMELETQLFEADLDATQLENIAKRQTHAFDHLGESGRYLAEILLRESCNYVVTLADKLPNFNSLATREILKRNRELLNDLTKILDIITQMRAVSSPDRNRDRLNFESQYRWAILRRLDRLELFGVQTIGAGAREYGLSIAYVSLAATGSNAPEPTRVERALTGVHLALIRGEAGSGKTTLLQWLAVRVASRDLTGPLASWNSLVPLYLRMRDFTDRDFPAPSEFLKYSFKNLNDIVPKDWCQTVLGEGALVLIDGIDELPATKRREFFSWLKELVTDFKIIQRKGLLTGIKRFIKPSTTEDDSGNSIVILSSRPAAIESEAPIHLAKELDNLGFMNFTLEPMTSADIQALITQWHDSVGRDLVSEDDREKLPVYERDLREAIRTRPAIRSLASNPLLCSMICALNWDRRQRLPDDRMELYKLALEMLLEGRDEERGVGPVYIERLRRSEKEELLGFVAYWMLRNGHSEADRDSVEVQIDRCLERLTRIRETAGEILQELLERSGVLRQPQYGSVDFIDRTFLEYLAARAAIETGDLGMLVDRAKEQSWRETIVFAAGHARGTTRDQLIKELLKKPWAMRRRIDAEVTAACCLETVRRNLSPELLRKLQILARRLFPPDDFAMSQLLAPAAEMEPELLEGHKDKGERVVTACIHTASIIGGSPMLEIISSYSNVRGKTVELELVRAWDFFDETRYRKEVIERREVIFGISATDIDEEVIVCLRLVTLLSSFRLIGDEYEILNKFRLNRELYAWITIPYLPRPALVLLSQLRSLEKLHLMSIQPNLLTILLDLPNFKELFLASTNRVNELEDRGVVVNYLAGPDTGLPDPSELSPFR